MTPRRDAHRRGDLGLGRFTHIGCTGPDDVVVDFLRDLAARGGERRRVVIDANASLLVAGTTSVDAATDLTAATAGADSVLLVSRHRARQVQSPGATTLRYLVLDPTEHVEALVLLGRDIGPRLYIGEHDRPASLGPSLRDAPGGARVGIAVLGPVALTGIDYPLERHPKLTELVVYLALHPEGATSRAWTAALWPDRRVPGQTIANRLSEARRILGIASDGRPRLRKSGDRHRVVEFSSDWDEFRDRTGASTDSRSADSLEAALRLVRGRPFDDLAQGQWTVFEGFAAEIDEAVARTALELGAAVLATEPERAMWAAQQALRACPFDERLHRLAMRAADRCGNRAGIEATLRTLALVLEVDGNPLEAVHPDTARLYEELTAASRA